MTLIPLFHSEHNWAGGSGTSNHAFIGGPRALFLRNDQGLDFGRGAVSAAALTAAPAQTFEAKLTRGIFGEVQLGGLLEQVFTPDQYAANVETIPASGARVEFAIKLPGQRNDGVPLWLPIDAKFPREDYERLLEAHDRADVTAAEAAARAIEQRLRLVDRNHHVWTYTGSRLHVQFGGKQLGSKPVSCVSR